MAEANDFSWLVPNTTALLENAKSIATKAIRLPSPQDLASFPVTLTRRFDRFIVQTVPNFILRHANFESWANQARNGVNEYIGGGAAEIAGEFSESNGILGWKSLLSEAVQAGGQKSYTGMLSYLTSRWAFSCVAMALILNRVAVYGSSRQRIHLTWNKRLALRLIPVMLFIAQIHKLLEAIKCQSSPDFMDLRLGLQNGSWGVSQGVEWQSPDGFLHWMSSSILFTSSDSDSCAARGMSSPGPDLKAPYGSYSLLWPTFLRLCLSHLLETISCSLQQTPLMTETAMSVFEHSLAFAEVEIMISQTLGVGAFASSKTPQTRVPLNVTVTEVPLSGVVMGLADATTSMAGFHRLDSVNIPIEVLLIALLSCCNALTANLISIFGKQRSLRLLNTGFWGCCFIASFLWALSSESFLQRSVDGSTETGRAVSSLLHFPTVVICGFVPHMIVLAGMCVCLIIYLIALILTAFSLSSNPNIPRATGLRERFAIAHDNLQAAVQVREMKLKWHEDFYTALLRIGFTALTAASEAVFLNEGRSVEMRQFTWLEEERLDEIESAHSRLVPPCDGTFQIAEAYGLPPSLPWANDQGGTWESGYAKERKMEKDKETGMEKIGENTIVYPHPGSAGVGAMQRTTRFYLLFIFIRGIFFLIAGYTSWGLGVCLDQVGITWRPTWPKMLFGKPQKASGSGREKKDKNVQKISYVELKDRDGNLIMPLRDDIDVAPELRKQLQLENDGDTESVFDERIYGWWKSGGWFGTEDESTDYEPNATENEDTTSVYSISTTASTFSHGSDMPDNSSDMESEPEGQRTPTQQSPHLLSRETSLEPSVENLLDATTLARLLNPQDKAAKDEARMLAAHFSNSNRILTRSQYRRELGSERSRILLAGRRPGRQIPKVSLFATSSDEETKRPLTVAEEADILESLIISRRKAFPASSKESSEESNDIHAQAWSCVVCKASPRTIIAWPCRCLCVCEDCRINLALNNFGNCVTCRRQVGGFVRLWVP